MRWLLCLLVAAVTGLASCTDDSEQEANRQPATAIELIPCASSYVEEWPSTSASTRADNPVPWAPTTPNKYYYYSDEHLNGQFVQQIDLTNNSIGIFFTQDGATPDVLSGYFSYRGDQWRSLVEIKAQGTYQLYGYIPYEEASASIAGNSTYANGAVLTLRGLRAVTPSDVCVVVGAKEGTGQSTVSGLTTGKFDYEAQAGDDAHNYVFLLFDHIYSAIRFRFTVDSRYDELRTIKLRELKLKCTEDGYKSNYDAVVTLAKTNGSSPIQSVVFSSDNNTSGAEYVSLYLWDGTENTEEVTTNEVILHNGSYTSFRGSFMPGKFGTEPSTNTSNFTLYSRYDVYDKKGNCVRKDCEAYNKINLTSIFSTSAIQRGHMYSLTMIVTPTYLYMLSEPDLDNPTVTFE
ncbi:MAG: hypothetical protein IK075_09450 [Prevotella sp.]|nr:hypothetical protein [Prevotella sp.]